MLVYNKADFIIISMKINLFSPWYSWKIAELSLNNNHSLKFALLFSQIVKEYQVTKRLHIVCSGDFFLKRMKYVILLHVSK